MLRAFLILTLAALTAVLTWAWSTTRRVVQPTGPVIRYVALGDSYTVGQGVAQAEAWPTRLTQELRKRGYAVELVATLAVTGWTTQELLDTALPIANSARPQLVTLLIGANDVVQGVSVETYQQRLRTVLDALTTTETAEVVLLTIPDFTVTPTASRFEVSVLDRIISFNHVIREEASIRELHLVDLTDLSRKLSTIPGMLVTDGLHPSAAQYERWLPAILEQVLAVLPQRK